MIVTIESNAARRMVHDREDGSVGLDTEQGNMMQSHINKDKYWIKNAHYEPLEWHDEQGDQHKAVKSSNARSNSYWKEESWRYGKSSLRVALGLFSLSHNLKTCEMAIMVQQEWCSTESTLKRPLVIIQVQHFIRKGKIQGTLKRMIDQVLAIDDIGTDQTE